MFYYNVKYTFPLQPHSPEIGTGGVIAASAMVSPQLAKRRMKEMYLQQRLFDPQLYLGGLDAATCGGAVLKLATYPWFGLGVPDFNHKKSKGKPADKLGEWKKAAAPDLLKQWAEKPAPSAALIQTAATEAVRFQDALGCQAIILPSPLTQGVGDYQLETLWLDAGIEAARALRVTKPLFATVAFTDVLVRDVPGGKRHDIVNIAAEHPKDTAGAILRLVDALVGGGGKRVLVGYAGSFGAIARAAGAEGWVSGFYLTQRRLQLAGFEEKKGAAMPRYYSPTLLGDIGLEEDIAAVASTPLFKQLSFDSRPADPLHAALANGKTPADVPEWVFGKSILAAAKGHYNLCQVALDKAVEILGPVQRVAHVKRQLTAAAELAGRLKAAGLESGRYTDLNHQTGWLEAFELWEKSRA